MASPPGKTTNPSFLELFLAHSDGGYKYFLLPFSPRLAIEEGSFSPWTLLGMK